MKIQDRRGGATAAADLLTTTISMETHGPCGPGIFNQWLVAHTQKPNSNIAKNLQRVKTFEEDTTPSLKTTLYIEIVPSFSGSQFRILRANL